MKRNFRASNSKFQFHNENPQGLLRAGDCVIRAITVAEDGDWHSTMTALHKLAMGMSRVSIEDKVYQQYLSDNGWVKQKQPRKRNNTKYTVHEFVELYPKGTYIVSIAGHLTTVIDGKIYDTWDCGFKSVGNFWTKEDAQ